MQNNNTSRGGIGLCGGLALVFIALKLMKVITWSWWWVLAPLWIPIVLLLAVLAFALIYEVVNHKH